MVENGGAKDFIFASIFLRIITFFIEIYEIVFSVFLSLDENLVKT